MTRHFATAFLALGALLVPPSATAASPGPAEGDLQADLDAARAEIQALTTEVSDLTVIVDEVVAYLHTQAQSAESMRETLSSAEAAGFTAGINYKSREILLSGWRGQLDAATSKLPGTQPAKRTPGQ